MMRYLDNQSIFNDDDDYEACVNACEEIESLESIEKKHHYIDIHDKIWKKYRKILSNISNHKCWYCETKFRESVPEVDHFRPKKAVQGESNFKGYWWLAFKPSNFRLSCPICNRVGKGTKFPLVSGSQRGTFITGINNEEILLLDPTNETDSELLFFNEQGLVEYNGLNCGTLEERKAEVSIRTYKLNYHSKVRGRKEVKQRCSEVLTLAKIIESDPKNQDLIDAAIKQGKRLIDPQAEYSTAALHYLVGFDNNWINKNIIEISSNS